MIDWLPQLLAVCFFGVAMAGYPCCCKKCNCCAASTLGTRAKRTYTVTFTGVANGDCVDCDDWNTTAFIVTGFDDDGTRCQWEGVDDLPCGFDLLVFVINCENPGTGLEQYQADVRAYHPDNGVDGDGGFRKTTAINPSTGIDCQDPGALTIWDSFTDNIECDWSGGAADIA